MSGQFFTMVALTAGKNPSTHSIGGWLGPRAGLDSCVEENNLVPLPGCEHLSSAMIKVGFKGFCVP